MNIYESIAAIIGDVTAVSKDKTNPQGKGYKYRGIDDVMNAMQPLFARYKVFVVPEVLEQRREERESNSGGRLLYSICKIKFTFFAEDGSNVAAVTIGEGMDSGDKATNKAMSVAFKYALFQVFCIPTEEMQDADAETPPESVPIYKCEQCGKEIKAQKSNKGEIIPPAQVAAISKQRHGRILCAECMRKVAEK